MKDLIKQRLIDHAKELIAKDSLNATEVNFLIYMLSKIENDEMIQYFAKEDKNGL